MLFAPAVARNERVEVSCQLWLFQCGGKIADQASQAS
jgi:hypothetical protein